MASRTVLALTLAALVAAFAAAPLRAQSAGQGEDSITQEILQTVCPEGAHAISTAHGKEYGCGVCPGFTSFKGQRLTLRDHVNFELRKVLTGSFTAAGENETLAEFFGCEPHAANFGGILLLERSGSELRRVRFFPGVIGILRTWRMNNGRDIVLSQGGYTGQGVSTGWVSTYEFPAKGDPVQHTLVQVEDNSGVYCQTDRIEIGYIPKLEFPDLNGDGIPDLRVTVRWGSAKVPEKFREHCELDYKPPEAPAYTIDFLFDGQAFRVAPGSAATLRRITAANQ
jgi:hypothetical protein